jgi:hypothetical protein
VPLDEGRPRSKAHFDTYAGDKMGPRNKPEGSRFRKLAALANESEMAVDAVFREPLSAQNSLLTGKITRNFADLAAPRQKYP